MGKLGHYESLQKSYSCYYLKTSFLNPLVFNCYRATTIGDKYSKFCYGSTKVKAGIEIGLLQSALLIFLCLFTCSDVVLFPK